MWSLFGCVQLFSPRDLCLPLWLEFPDLPSGCIHGQLHYSLASFLVYWGFGTISAPIYVTARFVCGFGFTIPNFFDWRIVINCGLGTRKKKRLRLHCRRTLKEHGIFDKVVSSHHSSYVLCTLLDCGLCCTYRRRGRKGRWGFDSAAHKEK